MASYVLLSPDCFTNYSYWEEYVRQLHGCGSSILSADGETIGNIWQNIIAESERSDSGYFGDDEDWARQAVEQWDRAAIDDD